MPSSQEKPAPQSSKREVVAKRSKDEAVSKSVEGVVREIERSFDAGAVSPTKTYAHLSEEQRNHPVVQDFVKKCITERAKKDFRRLRRDARLAAFFTIPKQVIEDIVASYPKTVDPFILVEVKMLYDLSDTFLQEAVRRNITTMQDRFEDVTDSLVCGPNVQRLLADDTVKETIAGHVERVLFPENGSIDPTEKGALRNFFASNIVTVPPEVLEGIDAFVALRVEERLKSNDAVSAAVTFIVATLNVGVLSSTLPRTKESVSEWLGGRIERDSDEVARALSDGLLTSPNISFYSLRGLYDLSDAFLQQVIQHTLVDERVNSFHICNGLQHSPNGEELLADDAVRGVVVGHVKQILFSQDEQGHLRLREALTRPVVPRVVEYIDADVAVQMRERLRQADLFTIQSLMVNTLMRDTKIIDLFPETRNVITDRLAQHVEEDDTKKAAFISAMLHDLSPDASIHLKSIYGFPFGFSDAFLQDTIQKAIIDDYDDFKVVVTGLEQSPDVRELFADEEVVSITTKLVEQCMLSRMPGRKKEEQVRWLLDLFTQEAEESSPSSTKGVRGAVSRVVSRVIPKRERGTVPSAVVKRIDNVIASRMDHTLSWIDISVIRECIKPGDTSLRMVFPKTAGKVRDWLKQQVAHNSHLAENFVHAVRLPGLYKEDPFVAECMKKAVTHYTAAKEFHKKEERLSWDLRQDDVPWLHPVKEVVQDTLAKGPSLIEEKDPYETSPLLFGTKEAHTTSVIAKLLAGEPLPDGVECKASAVKKIQPFLETVNKRIASAYSQFLTGVEESEDMEEGDKVSLLAPEKSSVKMTPLLETVRGLVARYLVQEAHLQLPSFADLRHHERDIMREIDAVLETGFKEFIAVHEIDIPLYDTLFEEYDNLRKEGRNPFEVYLGRDADYADDSRRAQDVARRRKLGREERVRRKEAGEVVGVQRTRISYPRYFRDRGREESKEVKERLAEELRRFLKDEGIDEGLDLLFFDTGFNGTIAEHIMKVQGLSEEEIEQRIRLLSAKKENRRVSGLDKNVIDSIVYLIEDRAKKEYSAEGFTRDKKTGKFRHIAMPTSAKEQFHFLMIQQAVTRHYWLKEMSDGQQSSPSEKS